MARSGTAKAKKSSSAIMPPARAIRVLTRYPARRLAAEQKAVTCTCRAVSSVALTHSNLRWSELDIDRNARTFVPARTNMDAIAWGATGRDQGSCHRSLKKGRDQGAIHGRKMVLDQGCHPGNRLCSFPVAIANRDDWTSASTRGREGASRGPARERFSDANASGLQARRSGLALPSDPA
jgi:hypothetical protein